MYIKSYECTRFAGLKDTSVKFDRGLNVILGPNESGKSTIIEGIHSTLFKSIKLRKSYKDDKDFIFKFMPEPDGDFIDGKVVLDTQKGQYEISKEWGSSENIQLLTPKGDIFKSEKDIYEELNKVLSFGESTYSNIVFAKQRELKEALSNIITNNEVTKEINHVLRMALMELDGISIDSIQKNIEDELDDLYKRWNRERNYPESNRGVNNPYKVGLGKIIESYYNKENLRISMDAANTAEKEFENISNNIKSAKEQKELINKEKIQLEKIEGDVNNRAILNAEINSISKELDILMEINKQWPKTEQLLEQLDEKINDLEKKKEKLDKEKKDLEKANRKLILEKKLENVEKINKKIEIIGGDISKIPSIISDDIDKLTKLQRDLLTCETTMKAGKMLGIVRKLADKPIYISKDFGNKEELKVDEEFEANGLIKISYADEFELEIKTGEVDFEQLIANHTSIKKEYDALLTRLGIDNIETGKLNLEKIRDKENERDALKRELQLILNGSTLDDIREELNTLGDIKVFKSLDDIEKELEEINKENIDISADKKSKENQVKSWIDKYTDHDNLFDLVIEERSMLKDREESLKDLKPLPEEFGTVEEFKIRLNFLKEQSEIIQKQLELFNSQYYQAKNNLSEITYEELKKEYLQAGKTFDRNAKRGEKLLEIQRVFHETKNRLASNPMESLANEFARLLEIITNGNYMTSDIDEEFNIRLINPNGEIPIELLSAGTYDSVSLALRFSLLKHVFKDSGYVILDDCLVDLDPERKSHSIRLINDLAEDYQIIFTTCDPHTAKMLGGNLIEL